MKYISDGIDDQEDDERKHIIKFKENVDDLVYKKTTECSNYYSIESLRLGFSRISNDNLVCIITHYADGHLSIKHMNDKMKLMIESIIRPYQNDDM